jgi:hypothetical protein
MNILPLRKARSNFKSLPLGRNLGRGFGFNQGLSIVVRKIDVEQQPRGGETSKLTRRNCDMRNRHLWSVIARSVHRQLGAVIPT